MEDYSKPNYSQLSSNYWSFKINHETSKSLGFEFEVLNDVAVDLDGNYICSDGKNNVLLTFNRQGEYIKQFKHDFKDPWGIWITPAGELVVANNGNQLLKVFESNGQMRFSKGGNGKEDGQFFSLRSVAVASFDWIYAINCDGHSVNVYSMNGEFLFKFGKQGNDENQMSSPIGITINSQDDIFIGDRDNARVIVYNTNGEFQWLFGKSGEGNGEFQRGRIHIAVDRFDRLFTTDYFQSRLQIFESNGSFISKLGGVGENLGEFRHPHGLRVDFDGNIIIADKDNHRIQIIKPYI